MSANLSHLSGAAHREELVRCHGVLGSSNIMDENKN